MSPISHRARVVSLPSQGTAVVRLTDMGGSGDGCAGCRISAVCTRSSEMVLEVAVPAGVSPAAGERVLIEAPRALGRRAVAATLLLPTAVLVAALAIAMLAGMTEAGAVAVGLLALGATFAALCLVRGRIESPAKWKITKIISD
ncbi:MAG: SoxR reducing system RseC family protein [Bacteroides sp.]|nr:SoxR reducing system RseC family protein [Bacteroides sp.]MCM1095361.1 SoxR reducing system RseC family protein [Terasakiella sp.]